MDLQTFLQSILGGGQQPVNRLTLRDQNLLGAGYQVPGIGMPQAAPQSAPMAAPAVDTMQTASAAPAPSSGGGGGFFSRLFGGGGGNPALNETAAWLEQQGYDQGTARALAGNKEAMQRILMSQVGGNKPIEINGRLVDPNTYEVLADFSDEKAQKATRTMSPDETAKLGLPPGVYQMDEEGKISSVGGVREQDPTFGREMDLRKEYSGREELKTYQIVRSNYERIREGAQLGTGVGDIAVIFGYMKMLDPTSVVREGEQATAENASGVGERVRNIYNRLLEGDKLPAQARKEFIEAASKVYKTTADNVRAANQYYTGVASQYQLDPKRILIEPEEYGSLAIFAPDTPELPLPPDSGPVDVAPGIRRGRRVN